MPALGSLAEPWALFLRSVHEQRRRTSERFDALERDGARLLEALQSGHVFTARALATQLCDHEYDLTGDCAASEPLALALGLSVEDLCGDVPLCLPPRSCRVCGCTDARACVVDGVPCHWSGPDLCSACLSRDDTRVAT